MVTLGSHLFLLNLFSIIKRSEELFMKKPRLVIADIDSTIVVKHKVLTPRAKRVINKLRQNDIYFGLASGRALFQIKEQVHKWGYDDFDVLMGMNGSTIWDSKNQKEYSYYLMKKEWIKETIELMEPFHAHPSVYSGNSQLFVYEDALSKLSSTFSGLKTVITHSMESLYQEDNAKIMFRVKESQMPEVEKYVAEHPSENYIGFKTQPTMMEFCDKRVNKGFGLEKICEMLDISLSEVVAFGDTTNDNEMLQKAGLGVCMKNGSDDTKAIADVITDLPCDADGWADYMEKHFLPVYGIE